MKKLLISSIFVAFSVFTFATPALASTKVTVCHNGHTITINQSALPAHLKHGDTEGACPVNVPEFGDIPGVIALVSSGVTFFFLNKRHI